MCKLIPTRSVREVTTWNHATGMKAEFLVLEWQVICDAFFTFTVLFYCLMCHRLQNESSLSVTLVSIAGVRNASGRQIPVSSKHASQEV
jgi:hypothetical protein